MVMGRPRTFDSEAAVAIALRLFVAKGYEGVSTAELAATMGIKPPSLYAAFGNKEALFRRAMETYAASIAPVLTDALAEPTARGVAERFLRGSVDAVTDPSRPSGCLFVQGALRCSDAATPVRDELALRRAAAEPALRDRFVRALAERDLPDGEDPVRLARYLCSVANGTALQAAGGVDRQELHEVVDVALRAVPDASPTRGRRRRGGQDAIRAVTG